jgi:transposase
MVIRIESIWLAVTRCWQVVAVFGAGQPHHAYCFANRRATRLKVLVHDGIGIWLAARRLHQGGFVWHMPGSKTAQLTRARLDALALGLPGSAWPSPLP